MTTTGLRAKLPEIARYCFDPFPVPAYKCRATGTEVYVFDGPGGPVISFYGMNQLLDALFALPFYRRECGRWVHAGAWTKLLSVWPRVSEAILSARRSGLPLTICGYSMGGAIGLVLAEYMRENHPEVKLNTCFISPFRSVIGSLFPVYIVKGDPVSGYPAWVPGHKNNFVFDSPYPWWHPLKRHGYLREGFVR